MRRGIVLLVLSVLLAQLARADPIRYEQIPADASGYFQVDVDRFLASHVFQELWGANSPVPEMKRMFGGAITSFTVCTVRRDGLATWIAMLHGDEEVRQKLEERAAGARDAVRIQYENQEVYYSSDGVATAALGLKMGVRRVSRPATAAPVARGSSFNLGLGDAQMKTWTDGPSYVAFVGKDLVVATTDLSAMADALDVIAGRKPSLATLDPQGMKAEVSPGTIMVGAGFAAHATINPSDLLDRPTDDGMAEAYPLKKRSEPSPGAFDLDLFGSLKGKARFARLDVGEDEKSFYIIASIIMTDSDSAEQVKNLITGVKALISLSQEQKKPLLDPLDVQSAATNVALHWSWPTAKLAELARLMSQGNHGNSSPTTAPAQK